MKNTNPDTLSEFVKQVLFNIVKGVHEVQDELLEETGLMDAAIIAPQFTNLDGKDINPLNQLSSVEFDLAVTTSDESSIPKGFGIIKVLKAYRNADENSSNVATNRIKFAIPVQLPNGSQKFSSALHKWREDERAKAKSKK